jgi:two-component system, OmpR family, response regulator
MQILAIEDNPETARYIASGLTEAGHQVRLAGDGPAGLEALRHETFDLMIVDRLLPGGLDGLSVVQTIRDQGLALPVLFLSALDGVDDRVKGLNAGGDDYLVKPFSLRELEARVAALGRRRRGLAQEILLKAGELEMNLVTRRVTRGGIEIELLPREWELLEYLLVNKGRLVTKKMLLETIWDFHFDPRTNVVETHISRLRQKIDKGFAPDLLQTVRGSGYMLRDPL